ncbi:hypothetical protein OC709_01790 ['Planchonia careya' phytoplasma]|nr:hypothetical protein ['Planchonia careya' phytoplasma]MDO8030242.1 hypothetical protein ['Planchonia careya' phytoplasma]
MLKKIQLKKLFILLLLNLFVINFYGIFINKQGNLSNSKLNNIKAFFDIYWPFLSKTKEIKPNVEKQLITENSIKKGIQNAENHMNKIIIILNNNQNDENNTNEILILLVSLNKEAVLVQQRIATIKRNFAKWVNKCQENKNKLTINNVLREYFTTLSIFNQDIQNINDRIIKIEQNITQKKLNYSNELFINNNSRNR